MLFAVIFHDHPGQGDLRAAHAQAHIDWLAAHADTVRVAGSLRETPDQVPKGGCGSWRRLTVLLFRNCWRPTPSGPVDCVKAWRF